MSITYGIINESHEIEGEHRTSYGIAAYSDVEVNGSACILCTKSDLSCERAPLEEFVSRLNGEQVSVTQLEERIEEYLATH
jgi:hypothetical protein